MSRPHGTTAGNVEQFPELILASASPRRKQLLSQIGLIFSVQASSIDEDIIAAQITDPAALAEQLALEKARDVANHLNRGGGQNTDQPCWVIGADTLVIIDGRVLGKPVDAAEAREMLGRLAGCTHTVITAVALIDTAAGREAVTHEKTQVSLRPLTEAWVAGYAATGEPMDKAGAYAIQGLGSVMVERVEGCYFNVVGLPLVKLALMLENWGMDFPAWWRETESGSSVPPGGL